MKTSNLGLTTRRGPFAFTESESGQTLYDIDSNFELIDAIINKANGIVGLDSSGQVPGALLNNAKGGISPGTSSLTGTSSLVAFGDSQTAGTHVNTPSQVWSSLLGFVLGLPVTNLAVDGSSINGTNGQCPKAFSQTPSAGVASIAYLGTNDSGNAGTATLQTNLGYAYTAFMTWLAMPQSNFVLAGALTYSGSWTASTYGPLTFKFSTTNGNTATGTVTGSVVYVCMLVSDATDFNSSFTISVDGTTYVTENVFNTGMTGLNAGHFPACFRIAGLTPGAHTVVVKNTSAGGTNFAAVLWMAGNNSAPFSLPVFVGGAAHHNGIADANVQALNTVLANTAATLAGDGLKTSYIDNYSAITAFSSVPSMFNSDNLHLNALGHMAMTAKWLNTILGLTGLSWATVLAHIAAYENAGTPPLSTGTNATGIVLSQYNGANGAFTLAFGATVSGSNQDLTAQAAAQSAVSLIASVLSAGQYRIDWAAKVTQAATSSSTLGGANGFQVTYTDADDSVAVTTPASVTSTGNTTGTQISGSVVVRAKLSSAITFSFGYTSSGVTPMQYALHIRITFLG